MKTTTALLSLSLAFLWPAFAGADQVILDDLILDGSQCVGFDCVNGETFGFNTIVLKENNVRIHFQDTSSSASFPTTDWTLEANDSASGGASYFAIVNADSAAYPFAVYAGAPDSALVVTERGVGLGVEPMRTFHMTASDTPTIRVEQNGLAGWPAYVWDIGANESSFFVRDSMTNELPLRIAAGAPTASVAIDAAGHVGLGTDAPAASLHVVGGDGTVYAIYDDVTNDSTWTESFGAHPTLAGVSAWTLTESQTGAEAARITADGQMEIPGALTQGSSRRTKHGFASVRADEVLDKVAALEISRWRYKKDARDSEHIGPMAEDFYRAFGLGADDRHIAPADMAAVALSANQALDAKIRAQADEIALLRRANAHLEERLARIERAFGQP
jgi:hypothetical protein